MGLTCHKLTLLTLGALTIQILGLSLFVLGFFPVKPALSGVSGPESFQAPGCDSFENSSDSVSQDLPPHRLKSLYQELSGIPPLFDRLILMVIDGLPAEFVLGKDGQPPRKDLMEAMPYTQSLLSKGNAIGYHAKAAPPTVTMPRLKAMVSGAIGGFLDVAFNFNTQALLDDNLLGQLFRIGWKMVMLGDETWLKLFPGLFMRHDGVSSFYVGSPLAFDVKDTVQVDQNVSRHLDEELSRDDWNLLILHYLGLDHVGHIGGRNSFLMIPKLMEMDEVVKTIHLNALQSQENGRQTLLVVVSDHGMTENGNHGGSSYEETDSLALFIGLKNGMSNYASTAHYSVNQVDIAPTLALLLGVPVPKNNVGVVISKTFGSLKDEKWLRVLELNAWQLLRLVQAQLPGLSCGSFPCDGSTIDLGSRSEECNGSPEKVLCCLYRNAALLHSAWKSIKVSRSTSGNDYSNTVAAYYQFMETASEWLSRRVTDVCISFSTSIDFTIGNDYFALQKPVGLLAFGVVAMVLSCLVLLGLLNCISGEVCPGRWCLDDAFILGTVMILVMSMGSSSMVEEEQYIWHFFLSTSYLLLLRRTVQSLPAGSVLSSFKLFKRQKERSDFRVLSIFLLLIAGRILRGWHQGGVNWTHLPDISKWLEQAGNDTVRSIQVASGILVICLGLFALVLFGSRRNIIQMVGFCLLNCGLLVLWHIVEYQGNAIASSSSGATLLAQRIYVILGITSGGIVLALPWFITDGMKSSNSRRVDSQNNFVLLPFRDSSYVIGLAYVLCWCLLQLLLQQPINSVPIFLLLIQILAILLLFSSCGLQFKEWVEVALLYYMGMAGHFALGNSNTLATVDVAGAFIGLSSHSTLLSGILMFIITYASPMLFLLSMVMYVSVKSTAYLAAEKNADSGHLLKVMLGLPCLVPLGLNSILLTAYTIVLLLMRNHLFVWSVFSPKYLYVCAASVCTYIGVLAVAATEVYAYFILVLRRKISVSVSNGVG
ncbi:hypothetical protein Tsubulata_002698 [Turnera subulata]|uniref:GPI ethanolamine phosphate transferase 2 C-terminal domain-containing protein n=1 Tax=Turnera subulata TaxID=218843 RepID=A0A9Q0F5M6_9ROSI|nr:hypothetical protein Tsubulata_002698 [Turnera subulata]